MPTDALSAAMTALVPLVGQYGYLTVAVLVFLEDFGVPVPGETVLILAATAAGIGRLDIVLVALIAAVAAVCGDNVGYLIGHAGGRPLLDRYGRYVFLTPARVDRVQRIVERHGGKVVAAARFVEGLRQANGLLAGAVGMRWRRFFLFNVIGAVAWVAVWSTLGYTVGDHLTVVYHQVTRYELYLLVAAAAVAAGFVGWQARRIHRERREHRDRGAEHDPEAHVHES